MIQAPETQSTTENLLERMERVVRRSNAFTLVFVKSNHPSQRREMSRALIGRLSDKRILEVDLVQPLSADPLRSLFDELRSRWDAANPPDAIFVYGFEKSIGPEREFTPNILRLNNDRELFQRFFPVPLLLWLPDFALDMMPLGAPDFWAWHSGVYEFPSDYSEWHRESLATLYGYGERAVESWPIQEKLSEVSRLEELYRTATSLSNEEPQTRRITARIAGELCTLYFTTGELKKSERWGETSLDLFRQLGDNLGMAAVLHQLAMISQDRDNLQVARDRYQQSLFLSERANNDDGIAATLSQLGWVYRDLGDTERARDYMTRSLAIQHRLSDRKGQVTTLHGLATLEIDRGNREQAKLLLHQLIGVEQAIGAKDSLSASIHQLGTLKADEGDFASAKELYEQGLAIDREAGNKRGAAGACYGLAMVAEVNGDLPAAASYLIEARNLSGEAWPTMYFESGRQLNRLRETVGDEQFRQWLHADFPRQASQILRELDTELRSSPEAVPTA